MPEEDISTEALLIYPAGIPEAVCTPTRHQGRETPMEIEIGARQRRRSVQGEKTEKASLATMEEIYNEADCSESMDIPSVSAIATSSDAGCEALSETQPTSSVDLIHPFPDHSL